MQYLHQNSQQTSRDSKQVPAVYKSVISLLDECACGFRVWQYASTECYGSEHPRTLAQHSRYKTTGTPLHKDTKLLGWSTHYRQAHSIHKGNRFGCNQLYYTILWEWKQLLCYFDETWLAKRWKYWASRNIYVLVAGNLKGGYEDGMIILKWRL